MAQPVCAASGEPAAELAGYISAWTQDCRGSACSLPKPGERNRPVAASLGAPSSPGEAAAASVTETLRLGEAEIKADITFYAICPYGGKNATCPGRYFQAQISLSGAAHAFCAASVNAEDFMPFPVMMCAGVTPGGARAGITLHRLPL